MTRDEIDEEFDDHLERCAEEIRRRQGLEPEHARAEAERRFGNRGTHRRRCAGQSKEHRMQRSVMIGMGIVVVALATLAADGWRRSHIAQRQVEDLRAELEHARTERDSAVGPRGVVYIDGPVARPGVYQLPEGGRLTASRLIAAAGGSGEGSLDLQLRLIRNEMDSAGIPVQREYRFSAHDAEQFAMQPDDHLIVSAKTSESGR